MLILRTKPHVPVNLYTKTKVLSPKDYRFWIILNYIFSIGSKYDVIAITMTNCTYSNRPCELTPGQTVEVVTEFANEGKIKPLFLLF